MNKHEHDFDDPDPTVDYDQTIKGVKYHEVIGEQCRKCDVQKLVCFKEANKTLGEPDQVYIQDGNKTEILK